jgi:hypothetical protein
MLKRNPVYNRFACLQIRLDQNGRKIGGRDSEYHTPQSQKLVQDKQGTVMQIDLGAAMSQMGDMEREMQSHEGCRCELYAA